MKALTHRTFVAAVMMTAAAFLVRHGNQKQVANGKYAEVNGLKMYYAIISCLLASLINCWRLWRRFSTRPDRPKENRRMNGAGGASERNDNARASFVSCVRSLPLQNFTV